MNVAALGNLPMGLGRVCDCSATHWERNIYAQCHTCGGHIHPCPAGMSVPEETRNQLDYMYDIKVVGFDPDSNFTSGIRFHYGMKPDGSRASNRHITHGTKPYRYDKKSPTKMGIIFEGSSRNTDELTAQARCANALFALNCHSNVSQTHDNLFAFAPVTRPSKIVIETAPLPMAHQAQAWHSSQQALKAWPRGAFTFVLDRRDFTPTLLPKFLAFWEYALLHNEYALFTQGESIGSRLITSLVSGADFIHQAHKIPYINPAVGISHLSRVPRVFRMSGQMASLMNRNHIKLTLLALNNIHMLECLIQALDCSMTYLREVSLRHASLRRLKHMHAWCLERSDRREAYPFFMEYMDSVINSSN